MEDLMNGPFPKGRYRRLDRAHHGDFVFVAVIGPDGRAVSLRRDSVVACSGRVVRLHEAGLFALADRGAVGRSLIPPSWCLQGSVRGVCSMIAVDPEDVCGAALSVSFAVGWSLPRVLRVAEVPAQLVESWAVVGSGGVRAGVGR